MKLLFHIFFLIALCSALFIGQAAAGPATVTDDDGTPITVEAPFRRIISLYPAHTENLFALGLDAEVIGVGTGDDFPQQVKAKDKKRFSYREDAEKLLAARPDLVLVRPMISRAYPELIDQLRRAGIAVVSLQPQTVTGMFGYWQTLGLLTGRAREARTMRAAFDRELGAIRDLVKQIPETDKKNVYFEAIHAKMKTFAPGSMALFVLAEAGGVNVAADAEQVRSTSIAAYGKEKILARGEAIDVFLAQTGRMNPVQVEDIAGEPGFGAIRAVREKNIFLVDEELVSRPTPRLLDGIQVVGRILYPEFFGGKGAGVGTDGSDNAGQVGTRN